MVSKVMQRLMRHTFSKCTQSFSCVRATSSSPTTHFQNSFLQGAPSQPFVAAPFFCTTSLHTSRKPLVHAAATLCSFLLFSTRFTLAVYFAFESTRRFAMASAKSIARNFFRSQAHTRSTGLRSGDLAGIFKSFTPLLLCAAETAAALRKLSL